MVFQRIRVHSLAPTRKLTTILTPVLGDLVPSSGFHRPQAGSWHTDTHSPTLIK